MVKRKICLLAALCLLLCGCGRNGELASLGRAESLPQEYRQEVCAPEGESGQASEESTGQEEEAISQEPSVCVYVCGAVKLPGVVTLPAGSRAADALQAAGGFLPEADTSYVNLAAWVADGEQLYFPTKEEDVERQADRQEDGRVNINTADISALCTLPGIGESRAGDIIAYREANGCFETEEDIMKVTGIKAATYEKIREKIKVR